MLNKIHLSQDDYFVVQNIYRGWALFGFVLAGNLLALAALAVVQRAQTAPFALVLIALASQIATLVIFFTVVFPANQATANWTAVPANWEHCVRIGNGARHRRGNFCCRLLRAGAVGPADADGKDLERDVPEGRSRKRAFAGVAGQESPREIIRFPYLLAR